MDDKLKNIYLVEDDNLFDFEIKMCKDDQEYEDITRPHLKDAKNPDGSGPNKARASASKMTDGFVYIVAKDKRTGEACGAESFQIYQLTNQAIPAQIYGEIMQYVSAQKNESYVDVKEFLSKYKSNIMIFETHRLMSWVRGCHLAGVMIYKLEEYVRENIINRDPEMIPVFFETVNQYSKSLPLRGAWIEISSLNTTNVPFIVAPFAGSVD